MSVRKVSDSKRFALVDALEPRQLFAADLRAFSGAGNNVAHPNWGTTGSDYLRLVAPAYADGKSAPSGTNRASARAISNKVAAHPAEEITSSTDLSAYGYAWGQFIDHDLDLTNTGTEKFNIAVPKGDPYFDPASTGTQVIPLSRSLFDAATGTTNPRQQVNAISAYIDGSMVYGSDKATADSLRTFTGGKLKTSAGNLLPTDASGNFLAGDVRVNENVELISIQTLFLREHNRLATRIATDNPKLTDEQVYQQARRLVIGEIQAITYNEFLPHLLGREAIKPYAGYKADVNAGVATEFSTAAFRLGHSMLPDDVEFLGNDGQAVAPEITLAQAFFDPSIVKRTGIDPLLKYLATSNSEEIDTKVVDSLRNFLFGAPGQGGLDLVSLNIQRGRDHGLADYNTVRGALGLPKVKTFEQITSNKNVQAALRDAYGTVDNIDLWVGGLAEDHLPGSNLGPTFQRLVADQFTRSRDGDRFFYLNDLKGKDLEMVQGSTLSAVISRNSTITNIQPDAFRFSVDVVGRLFADGNGDGKIQPVEGGIGNRTVTLSDGGGTVLQTTKTDKEGIYHFSDVPLGKVSVSAEVLTGFTATTAKSVALNVTKGQLFDHVDFGQKPVKAPPPPTGPTPPPPGPKMASNSTAPAGASSKLLKDPASLFS